MIYIIDSKSFLEVLRKYIGNLEKYRDIINSLNNFPIADKDTANNLIISFKKTFNSVSNKHYTNFKEFFEYFLREFSKNSIGSSGNIFSSFFKGIKEGIRGNNLNIREFVESFKYSILEIRRSLEKIEQGTIFTAIELIYHFKNKIFKNFNETLNKILSSLEDIGINKWKAIDSGAIAFIMFFELFFHETPYISEKYIKKYSNIINLQKIGNSFSGYCVSLIIKNFSNLNEIKEKLSNIGKELVLNFYDKFLKVHIHVKDLDCLFKLLQELGLDVEIIDVSNI